MRVGLIGLGRIGLFHAETLTRLVDDLIVADADQDHAAEVAGRLGSTLGDPWSADALVIATPTSTHAELLVRACERRIPVFCEKPAAPTVVETIRVAEAAERGGTLVHIGFQRRFDAGFAAARQALFDGELGELHRAHLLTGDPRPPAPEYVPSSGGIFRDCHIHDFDILRWVTGLEADTVYATGANRGEPFFAEAGDVDTSAAVITMADGTLVTLQGSRYNGAGYDVRMELAGTRATWAVGRGERDSPCTVRDALAALHLAEAADLSRRDGRPVQLAEVTK
ncbi:Gfo/Idh/MocA family oxidoreductase [Nonomuraea sp. NPDC049725]|uniref:Gfo/Idh/MocA family protein n=1 Tax=Nonomuraea sp. NPDC049725 TaxID=3154508 RepID=UPI00342BFD28